MQQNLFFCTFSLTSTKNFLLRSSSSAFEFQLNCNKFYFFFSALIISKINCKKPPAASLAWLFDRPWTCSRLIFRLSLILRHRLELPRAMDQIFIFRSQEVIQQQFFCDVLLSFWKVSSESMQEELTRVKWDEANAGRARMILHKLVNLFRSNLINFRSFMLQLFAFLVSQTENGFAIFSLKFFCC